MSLKSMDEAMKKKCIIRFFARYMYMLSMHVGGDKIAEDFDRCIGDKCAQYGLGRHRCGFV